MLSKRTIIGFVIGSIIIALGGYSLVSNIGPTIDITENFGVDPGNSIPLTIPAPANTPQSLKIIGDTFDLKLQSPGEGKQIPNTPYKDQLTLEWIHSIDGDSKIVIQNTGNSELEITIRLRRTLSSILAI